MSVNPAANITLDIIQAAKSQPNEIAIIYRDSKISYEKLDSIVWQGANFLFEQGIRSGDVIAVYAYSDWYNLVLMLSICRIGATMLSLFPSSSELQIKEIMHDAKVKFIVGDQEIPYKTNVSFIKFNDSMIQHKAVNEKILDLIPNAPWIIVSGSGTTGKSKLIPISHQAQRSRNQMSNEWLGLKKNDVVASMSHLSFHGPKNRLLETLWSGGSYYLEIYKDKDILHTCNQYLTVLHATVFHIQKLLELQEKQGTKPLSIRALTVGGSSVPFHIRQKIKQYLTNNLIVRYASNETGPIACVAQPEVFDENNLVGKPLSNIQVKILQVDNKNPTTDGSGLIAIESPANFNGYLNDHSLNANLFTQNGFILGDLGKLDQNGNLYHLGRFDHMMIFNGMNIYPAEIERFLLAHPMIDDATSFPIHHDIHQDIPVAAVCLKPDSILEEKEILAYCKSGLGAHAPHRIFILNELTRNERGKVVVENLLKQIKNKFYE